MVILRTEHLVLREFEDLDCPAVHQYASDPEVVRFEVWGPNTEEQSREFVTRCLQNQTQSPRASYDLAITTAETGLLIGGCAIRLRSQPGDAEIGYTLSRMHWGRGLGTEVACALVHFGFRQLCLDRIWADCDVENLPSIKVLQKVGMRYQSLIKDHRACRGSLRDSYLYVLTAAEYQR